jgi:multiple sugar transport system permease protein
MLIQKSLRQVATALPFVSGALAIFALVVAYPLLYALWVSLHRWFFGREERPFVGTENYQAALGDPFFLDSLWVTVIFVTGAVVSSVVVGLALAVVLSRRLRGKSVIRVLLLVPFVMTPVITALVWKVFFFDAEFGLINYSLRTLGLPEPEWLTNGATAMAAVIFVDFWNYTPMVMLVLGAAIANLPKEPFEAARIDGASATQQFFKLTLPMIRGPLVFIILFRITQSFKVFEIVHVMTGGGPGFETRVLGLYIYDTALNSMNMGTANAQSYLMMLLILAICGAVLAYGMRGVGRMVWEK